MQVPSGFGSRLQPRGTQADVHDDGGGGCEVMLTQVCACAPLQVCATGLQVVWVAPLQGCCTMLLQLAGDPPTQASRVEPLQAAGVPAVHVALTLQVPAAPPAQTPGWPLHTPTWLPPQTPATNPEQLPVVKAPLHVPAFVPPVHTPGIAPEQVGWIGFGLHTCGLVMLLHVCGCDGPVCGQSGLVISHQSVFSF
jgi:hypothetical protein